MKNISKILVPLDFSAHSKRALEFAVDLARRYDARLELVNVFDITVYTMPDGMPMFAPGQFDDILADIERLLGAAKHDALAGGALLVETKRLEGKPETEILREAREGKFDLIVLGTHGRTGLKHIVIGSVAERVVRHAPCPVFTVKAVEHTEAKPVEQQARA
jgi:nucleotide-binding universal stress UspA family protein